MSDATDPVAGKYYQTENNLPWAVDLPVSFAYSVETVSISFCVLVALPLFVILLNLTELTPDKI